MDDTCNEGNASWNGLMENDRTLSRRDAVALRMRPEAPHDEFTFEQLGQSYNFESISDRARVFTRLVIDECRNRSGGPVRVLDIGCGKGIELCADFQWAIREHTADYWGLEPDRSIVTPAGLFDAVQQCVLEDADLPHSQFDVAYSFMVMEHVDDPARFMQTVHRSLRPGGVYLFATPNNRHYFTRIASALHALHVDELVLRAVRRESAPEYHYPVRYRFNSESAINACAQAVGFAPPEYVYLEELGPRSYFPRPLRFIFHALAAKRRLIHQRNALITMVCRMTKPLA